MRFNRWRPVSPEMRDDVLALQMKAACLIQLGRKPDARQTLQIILALDPKNAWALARAAELK